MEIEYKGANCVTIKTKQTVLVVDPLLTEVGLKDQLSRATTCLLTSISSVVKSEGVLVFNGAGEYEVASVSIRGVSARAHTDTVEEGRRATMYAVDTGEARIAIVGHIAMPLDEEQLESLGVIDIAIIPVGGNGFTLDAHEAVDLVRQLNPKVVIPTHYAESEIKYSIPQQELENFVKELSAPSERMPKFKTKGSLSDDALQLAIIERTA